MALALLQMPGPALAHPVSGEIIVTPTTVTTPHGWDCINPNSGELREDDARPVVYRVFCSIPKHDDSTVDAEFACTYRSVAVHATGPAVSVRGGAWCTSPNQSTSSASCDAISGVGSSNASCFGEDTTFQTVWDGDVGCEVIVTGSLDWMAVCRYEQVDLNGNAPEPDREKGAGPRYANGTIEVSVTGVRTPAEWDCIMRIGGLFPTGIVGPSISLYADAVVQVTWVQCDTGVDGGNQGHTCVERTVHGNLTAIDGALQVDARCEGEPSGSGGIWTFSTSCAIRVRPVLPGWNFCPQTNATAVEVTSDRVHCIVYHPITDPLPVSSWDASCRIAMIRK